MKANLAEGFLMGKANKVLCLTGIFFFCFSAMAQKTRVFTLNIFFATDKAILVEKEKVKIEHLLDTLDFDRIKSISLKGHTDSRADSLYNVKLSERRTGAVAEFMKGLDVPMEKVSMLAFGENLPVAENETDLGKQRNRRVEIRLVYLFPPSAEVRKDTVKITVHDTCTGDTTLRYSTGIMLRMDRCNFRKMGTCVKVMTISNASEIRAGEVRMRDNRGNELESDGMFKLEWDSTCGPCGNFRTKWIMTEEEMKVAGYNFYAYNENTREWNGLGKRRVKKIKINGENFYEVELTCSDFGVRYNKDKKRPKRAFSKIKVAGRWKFVGVESQPNTRGFYYWPYSRTEIIDSRKKWKRLPAKSDVYIIVSKRTGDTLHLPFMELSPRKFRPFKARLTTSCMEDHWPHLGTVKLTRNKTLLKSERLYYRKYKIKAKTIRRLLRNKRHDRILR